MKTRAEVNRKTVEAYNAVADNYDDAYSDDVSRMENLLVMSLVGDVSGASVLDIGCGTGMFYDALVGPGPSRYVGIDPSIKMLERFVEKHGRRKEVQLVGIGLEEYIPDGSIPPEFKADIVLCLFGSVSHIDPAAVARIPELVNPGGRSIVMFLASDYEPEGIDRLGLDASFLYGIFEPLDGSIVRIGGFETVVWRKPL